MHKQTYTVGQERETLVYEETYDTDNNLIHYIDHQARPVSEKKIEYNDKNQIVNEIEISDGVELQNLEMKYNDKGEILEQNLYFSGSLYESVKTDRAESGFITTTYQDDEEVFRIEKTVNGKNYTTKYFDSGNLSNLEISKYDDETSTSENSIFDAEDNLLVRRIQIFDKDGSIEVFKEFNANSQLVNKREYVREENKVLKEVKSDFVRGEIDNEILFEYDDKGNLVKTETRTSSGKLIDFQVNVYDDNNRVIEESGVSNGKFNAIYGTYIDSNNYHFIHKYI